MIRFFAAPEDIEGNNILLSADDSEHIKTLRLSPNEEFIVCDGDETDYICKLGEQQETGRSELHRSAAQILRKERNRAEPTVHCTVYLAYTKGDRLDYAVGKSVELGAFKIVLFNSMRCTSVPANLQKKTARLQKISMETAKQCGRGIVPEVTAVGDFRQAAEMAASKEDISILCYEEESNLRLTTVLEHYFSTEIIKPLEKIKTIALIIGPEGGFDSGEVKYAQEKVISIVSLGPRILRSETAPVAALSAIMYHTRNL